MVDHGNNKGSFKIMLLSTGGCTTSGGGGGGGGGGNGLTLDKPTVHGLIMGFCWSVLSLA